MNEEEKKMVQAVMARFQELIHYGLSNKGKYDEEVYTMLVMNILEQAGKLGVPEAVFIESLKNIELQLEQNKNASLH